MGVYGDGGRAGGSSSRGGRGDRALKKKAVGARGYCFWLALFARLFTLEQCPTGCRRSRALCASLSDCVTGPRLRIPPQSGTPTEPRRLLKLFWLLSHSPLSRPGRPSGRPSACALQRESLPRHDGPSISQANRPTYGVPHPEHHSRTRTGFPWPGAAFRQRRFTATPSPGAQHRRAALRGHQCGTSSSELGRVVDMD
jgi:hypothetical protein